MKILVLYDSIEGHTRKLAQTVAEQLESAKHEVFLTQVTDPGYCDPAVFDASILCAPIHMGTYPPGFEQYIQDWQASLASVPTAMISVSLGIASKNLVEVDEASEYPLQLFERTNWQADLVHNAAGALKYTKYNYFKRWMMRQIAEEENGPVDTNKDFELTDWDALSEFVNRFVKLAYSNNG